MANRSNRRAQAAQAAIDPQASADAIIAEQAAIQAAEQAPQAAEQAAIVAWPFPRSPIEAPSAEEIEAEQAEENEALAMAQRRADAIANAMLAAENAPSNRSAAKKEYIHRSSILKPTKKVWAIADAMIAHADENNLPRPSRAEIIAECIDRGIASGTSATQYQAWKKAMGY